MCVCGCRDTERDRQKDIAIVDDVYIYIYVYTYMIYVYIYIYVYMYYRQNSQCKDGVTAMFVGGISRIVHVLFQFFLHLASLFEQLQYVS